MGYFRRNHWVPVPRARDIDELNEQLLTGCRQDQQRQKGSADQSVGQAMTQERAHLLPLAEEGFELVEGGGVAGRAIDGTT